MDATFQSPTCQVLAFRIEDVDASSPGTLAHEESSIGVDCDCHLLVHELMFPRVGATERPDKCSIWTHF